ncbi:MAG: trypsin-like peptidase domain-containing protein [Ruminococcus sp.]|nr:trypsin-like peptidase domain-containing protein [Ruminococcus sp.]
MFDNNNNPNYDNNNSVGGNNYSDQSYNSNYSQDYGSNSYQNSTQNTDTTGRTVNSYEWGNSENGGYYNHYKEPKKKKEKKPVSRTGIAIALVACILLSGLLGVGGGVGTYFLLSKSNAVKSGNALNINKSDSTGGSEGSADGTVMSTEQISEKVADSVVEIVTETVSYSYFYGQGISEGAGSGVIIDANGYIVTNNHVIEGAKSIKVTLRNGNEYTAKLIGTDADKDVALIKIEPKSDDTLTVATLGDSDKLAVGDKAVAIGNPLGQLGGTVTDGIISALDRKLTVGENTMNLLQTDAAINPGNSGGGLFDGQGNLIGIVEAKASNNGVSSTSVEGLGFAIPINDVQGILSDLKEYGYVKGKPASIGVTLQTYMDMVYVYAVEENSAADKAGLQKGDKVMRIDGDEIKSSSDVKAKITESKAGDKLKFEIERNGEKKTVEVTIEEEKNTKTQEATSYENNLDDYDDYDDFDDFYDDGDSIWDNFGY